MSDRQALGNDEGHGLDNDEGHGLENDEGRGLENDERHGLGLRYLSEASRKAQTFGRTCLHAFEFSHISNLLGDQGQYVIKGLWGIWEDLLEGLWLGTQPDDNQSLEQPNGYEFESQV